MWRHLHKQKNKAINIIMIVNTIYIGWINPENICNLLFYHWNMLYLVVLSDYYVILMSNSSYLHFYLDVFPFLICTIIILIFCIFWIFDYFLCQIWWFKRWKYNLQCLKIPKNDIYHLKMSVGSCLCVGMIWIRHTHRHFQL